MQIAFLMRTRRGSHKREDLVPPGRTVALRRWTSAEGNGDAHGGIRGRDALVQMGGVNITIQASG